MKFVYIILLAVSLAIVLVLSGKKSKHHGNTVVVSSLLVNKTDTALRLINGVYYYRQQLFSGTITDSYETGAKHHEINCYQGKEEGWTIMYYASGKIAEKRYYQAGEKDSVHTGWWENGSLRFEYHFSKGLYNGNYKEWYSSGAAYKHVHYTNGADEWGKGWRENGKLFMNYMVREGRRYGIVNSNLCYTLKNQKGVFAEAPVIVKSKKNPD